MFEIFNIAYLFNIEIDFRELFIQNWFMLAILVFWLAIASIQDIRKREVENWWSFGLILIALVFRVFLSVEKSDIMYFVWGVLGFAFGFLIMNIFYYARLFAGGDAKLLMAICCVLPLSLDWKVNIFLFLSYIILFLFAGAIYGFLYSFIFMILNFSNFKKEFARYFGFYWKSIVSALVFIGVLFFILRFSGWELYSYIVLILGLAPLLFVFAKAIEESSMNRLVNVRDLTVGDWIAEKIKVRGKIIKPYWEGLNEKELALIQKHYRKKVLVKYGLPFVPAFLIAITIMLLMALF